MNKSSFAFMCGWYIDKCDGGIGVTHIFFSVSMVDFLVERICFCAVKIHFFL